MADSADLETLKRRGRRRLVGAIALVLVAVIVLPMVFDPEPKAPLPAPSVRIPAEEDGKFVPRVTPRIAEVKPEAKADPAAESKPVTRAEPKPGPVMKAEPAKPEPAAPAPDKAAVGGQFVVAIAALADPEKLKTLLERLAAEKIPHYTEPVATKSGSVTRVRAGPFASRTDAERMQKRLADLGLKPGNVLAK